MEILGKMPSPQSDDPSTKHCPEDDDEYDPSKDKTERNQSLTAIRVKAEEDTVNTPSSDTIDSSMKSIAVKAELDLPPDISSTTEQPDDIDYNVALQALWNLMEQNAPNSVNAVPPNQNQQSAVPVHYHSTDSTVEHMVQSVLSMPMSTSSSMSMSNPLPPPICPIPFDLQIPPMFPVSSSPSSSSDAMVSSDHIDGHRAVCPLPTATSLHSARGPVAIDDELQNMAVPTVRVRGGDGRRDGGVVVPGDGRKGPIGLSLPSAESLMAMDDEPDGNRHRYR